MARAGPPSRNEARHDPARERGARMLLMATQAMPQMRAHAHPNLGRLVTPRHYCSVKEHDGLVWAADNDCYNGLKPRAYNAMLDVLKGAPGRCLFVTVPDVLRCAICHREVSDCPCKRTPQRRVYGDARRTAEQFEIWAPALERRGLPVALVAQDGLEHLVDWYTFTRHRLKALFIGGSTEWKLGPAAAAFVADAKAHGLWVHMGRVNSARRIRYADWIGCDSIDGTKWVLWRDRYLDEGLSLVSQLRLEAPPVLDRAA